MVRIVPAVTAGAAPFVMFTLPRATVLFARTAGSEFGTARNRAGAQDPPHPTGLLVGYHARLGIHTDQTYRDLGEQNRGHAARQFAVYLNPLPILKGVKKNGYLNCSGPPGLHNHMRQRLWRSLQRTRWTLQHVLFRLNRGTSDSYGQLLYHNQ